MLFRTVYGRRLLAAPLREGELRRHIVPQLGGTASGELARPADKQHERAFVADRRKAVGLGRNATYGKPLSAGNPTKGRFGKENVPLTAAPDARHRYDTDKGRLRAAFPPDKKSWRLSCISAPAASSVRMNAGVSYPLQWACVRILFEQNLPSRNGRRPRTYTPQAAELAMDWNRTKKRFVIMIFKR